DDGNAGGRRLDGHLVVALAQCAAAVRSDPRVRLRVQTVRAVNDTGLITAAPAHPEADCRVRCFQVGHCGECPHAATDIPRIPGWNCCTAPGTARPITMNLTNTMVQ